MSPGTRGVVTNGTGRAGRGRHGGIIRGGARKAVVITQEDVEEERAKLIQERQNEVQRVLDKHDDLVRERFHLEKFVSLLGYDPKEAKRDTSNVFLEYKARYDLIDHTVQLGPSRATRRAHTERLQALHVPAPVPSAPPKATKKSKVAGPGTEEQTPDMLWSLLSDAKSKGKEKVDPDAHISRSTNTAAVSSHSRSKTAAIVNGHRAIASPHEPPTSTSLAYASRLRKRQEMAPPPDSSPRKKRKIEPLPQLDDDGSISHAARTRRTSGRLRSVSNTDNEPPESTEKPPSPTCFSLKRIKLIVRRPTPTISHPLQRPPLPRFGDSVSAFLSSYVILDHTELDEPNLRKLAQHEAEAWRDIDRLRAQGRLFRPPDEDSSTALAGALGGQRKKDVWDELLGIVQEQGGQPLTRGPEIAAQVASCVRAYWEAQAVRDDKARAQEEKRLRALAKAMIRMVTAEWKKVVFHIREQERLKWEAEERRRGHEHLDAILDQSGQILEAQQMELARIDTVMSHSRSRSASSQPWDSPSAESNNEEDSDNSEDGSTDEAEEHEESEPEETEEPEEGADSSMLLSGLSEETTETVRGASNRPSYTELRPSPARETISSSRHTSPASLKFSPVERTVSLPSNETLFNGLRRHTDDSSCGRSSPVPITHEGDEEDHPATDEPRQTPSEDYEALPPETDDPVKKGRHISFADEHRVPFAGESIDFDGFMSLQAEPVLDLPMHGQTSQPRADVEQEQMKSDNILHIPEEPKIPEESTAILDETETPIEDDVEEDSSIPLYLRPYAVTPVDWDPQSKIKAPALLRGNLRPYQQTGLEWLASLHSSNLNGILADEMGLGKTIQTIALLAHLACDHGIWGPHLIIVPTSVLLNWEMEFKKFLPGFKVLSYHGNSKRRKELRQGWNNKYHFNVCVTSYTLASRDAHVFKRKPWYYMILDEAHMIKNFRSQRWSTLLMFRSFRRLLLTGTPLQNNLTELWALLQFLMSGTNFANLKEFAEWFANPLEKAIEMGNVLDDETQQRVTKLHTVLRPYLLRRLKRDVEKELPSKFEHVVMCPLSKRQRFLYDEFMARADTRNDLNSGIYQKIANILMQLRKVVNHPNLFEVRPIKTSLAMTRSAIADFEIKELLIRRELLRKSDEEEVSLDLLGLQFVTQRPESFIAIDGAQRLDGTSRLPLITELPGEPPPRDTRTIAGYRRYTAYADRAASIARWAQIGYINRLRCNRHSPVYAEETVQTVKQLYQPLLPSSELGVRIADPNTVVSAHSIVKSYSDRVADLSPILNRFTFVTPAVVARDVTYIALAGTEDAIQERSSDSTFDAPLHAMSVKLQIAFPDPSLLQYDCGKLQVLARLLRERKAGGHRVLIFTQMTRVLDILEIFLNLHGYLYLRLDGATKIEDRQYITERFNTDPRVFCFISSSRSGGVGINLTGADTVVFYDSDFNPQMDRQCEDRAHRIGQIRDVHIYRFVSQHTVEEALLRKANQKRSLDDIVIQKGEFDWRSLFGDENALTTALGEFEDTEDARAAKIAAREEGDLVGADEADFGTTEPNIAAVQEAEEAPEGPEASKTAQHVDDENLEQADEGKEEEGGTTIDYMLAFVRFDIDFFSEWRI